MTSDALLDAHDLRKVFTLRGTSAQDRELVAVDAASFTLDQGASLAVVGESGSGKSTLASMIVGLTMPTSGTLRYRGELRTPPKRRAARRERARQIQIVFQDPFSSLDPRQSGMQGLDELLTLHFDLSKDERRERILDLGEQVGLGARDLVALPRSLSGGQRQRLAIMRALALDPELLVLDEAVSALDVSVQAQILNLLIDIRRRRGLTYIFVSHDLAVVRQISDRIIVMRQGKVVEAGTTEQVLSAPQDPYTQLLLECVPGPGWKPRRRDRG